jgi:putative DNA primase/helicase
MEWGSLIDEFKDDKGQTKQRRKIDSLAAVVVADALRDELAWDADAGCWLTWQESHWQTHIQPAAADTLLAHAVRIGCGEHGYRLTYLTGITQLVQRLDLLARPARPEGVVPFKNGLLDLHSGELYAPTPGHALDWCLPHDYDPQATCPGIHAWLLRATDHDGETVELLRAWLAALVRGIPLQKFLVLIGRGGTGKGTFQRLAAALVGDANVAISTLRDLEGNRFETAKLYGKRLCMINEAGRHGGALNMLKSMTGGDALPLERKHQQQTGTFVFDGLTLLATNEDVQSTDATSGLERRRVTVRFPTTATEAERADWQARGGEAGVLHAEIPGLINWLLQLDERAIRQRFEQLPESVRKENLLGMAAGNPVADWLITCTEAEPDGFLQIGVLNKDEQGRPVFDRVHEWAYQNYRAFCLETGRDHPASLVKFREIVTDIARDLGRPVEFTEHPTKRTRILKGLRLRGNPLESERVREGCERTNLLKNNNSRGSRGFDDFLAEKNPDDPDHTEETHRYVM